MIISRSLRFQSFAWEGAVPQQMGKLVNQLVTHQALGGGGVGYIRKGDVEVGNILGMRILQTRQGLPPAQFFPTLILCDV